MAPQSWMVPRQKYDLVHYLREAYLKPHNPSQYSKVDGDYLAKLPMGSTFGPAAANVEPWVAMDYGPSLINTYETGPGPNFAYKGVAMRLDAGGGGVSRGKRWMVFDHDTLRVAAAWSNDGFIDWKGIHFNGQHQVHPKIAGEVLFANPIGPGWADPATGRFDDPRFRGRDRRPYGPLPREWARFRGLHHFGDQTVISYRIGDADILELDRAEAGAFTRTLEIGKSSRDLLCRVAPVGVAAAMVGNDRISLEGKDGFTVLRIPAVTLPARVKVLIAKYERILKAIVKDTPPRALEPLTHGGPKHWPETIKTSVAIGKNDGPFAVDVFAPPDRNPRSARCG
jgi:hypothetical protein